MRIEREGGRCRLSRDPDDGAGAARRADLAEIVSDLYETAFDELVIDPISAKALVGILEQADKHVHARQLSRLSIDGPADPIYGLGALLTHAFPRLRWLELIPPINWARPRSYHDLSGLVLPELELLCFGVAGRCVINDLPELELPRLETLNLTFHCGEAEIAPDVLRSVLTAFPLRHLYFRHALFARVLLRELPDLPIAARLKSLALAFSPIDEATTKSFVKQAHRFPELESLSFLHCFRNDQNVAMCRNAFPSAWCEWLDLQARLHKPTPASRIEAPFRYGML